MKTAINQRFKILIDRYFDGNQRQVAIKSGLKTGTVNTMYKGTSDPSFSNAATLFDHVKQWVNPYWFLLGDGPMELTEDSHVSEPEI